MFDPFPILLPSDYAVLGLLQVEGSLSASTIASQLSLSDEHVLSSVRRLRCCGRIRRSPYALGRQSSAYWYALGEEVHPAKMLHLNAVRAGSILRFYGCHSHRNEGALVFGAVEAFRPELFRARELALDGLSEQQAQWLSIAEISVATGLPEDVVARAAHRRELDGWIATRSVSTDLGIATMYADWSVSGGRGPKSGPRREQPGAGFEEWMLAMEQVS